MTISITANPALAATDPVAMSAVEPVSRPRKRGRPRDPDADNRILEAASTLILTVGYDAMTVDDVAARARVGKATVYRRFAKKEGLAVAAMRRLYDNQMPVPDTGTLRGDLVAALTAALIFARSEAGAAHLRTAVAESSRDPRIAGLYRAANDEAEAGSREIFARAIARGEARADINLEAAVQLIPGILLVRTVTGTPMPGLDEVNSLVDLLVGGMG